MDISLRIILRNPTAGVDFGLQKGRGRNYEVVQKQRSTGKDLTFDFSAAVKTAQDGAPDFTGPFVQGSRGDRYVYIDIGTYAGQADTCWSRRLKIPLSRITSKLIKSHSTLIADVPGAGKNGEPNCAYGWMKKLDQTWQWNA